MIICLNMKQTGNMKGGIYSIIYSSQPNCGSQELWILSILLLRTELRTLQDMIIRPKPLGGGGGGYFPIKVTGVLVVPFKG